MHQYRRPFVTLHDVIHEDGEARLSAARLLTPEILRSILVNLGETQPLEILPECVLARTADSIVWWSPPKIRPLFFTGADPLAAKLNSKQYPHPPLVFKVSGDNLWIRAFAKNRRPTGATKLCVAPYWNVYDNGAVCTGSVRLPTKNSVAAIEEWEGAFFHSAFSHAGGVIKHTLYPGGVLALWKSLRGRIGFPVKYLNPLDDTLEQFVTSNEKGYQVRRARP